MYAVVPLAFEDRLFRAVEIGDSWWFIAGDVAKTLGYREAEKLTRTLDADEKGKITPEFWGPPPHNVGRGSPDTEAEAGTPTHNVGTPAPFAAGMGSSVEGQEVSIISEPGLCRAIVQRRAAKGLKPEVLELIARFQRWVFHDVLPTLRKTGRYAMPGAESQAEEITPPSDATASVLSEGQKLAMVREARRIYGIKAAREMWVRVGFTDLSDTLPSRPAAAPAGPTPEAEAVGAAVLKLVAMDEHRFGWSGPPARLFGLLTELSGNTPGKGWPSAANGMAMALYAAAPGLRAHGIRIERRHSGTRTISITVDPDVMPVGM